METPVLEVKNLTIQYKDAEKPVVQNLSFSLNQGEI